MEIRYHQCDRCGAKIEHGTEYKVQVRKIHKIWKHYERSLELCEQCVKAVFPKRKEASE